MSNDLLDRQDEEVPFAKPDMDAVREIAKDTVKRHGGKVRITSWDKGQFSFCKIVHTWKWSE